LFETSANISTVSEALRCCQPSSILWEPKISHNK